MYTRFFFIFGISFLFWGCVHFSSDSSLVRTMSARCYVNGINKSEISITVANMNDYPVACAHPYLGYILRYVDGQEVPQIYERNLVGMLNPWKNAYYILDRRTGRHTVSDTGIVHYTIPMPEEACRLISLDIELQAVPLGSLASFKTVDELHDWFGKNSARYHFAFPSNMPADKVSSVLGVRTK